MATSLHTVKTYLNDEELAGLNALAAQLRLSKSDLLRRLLTATPLPEASDFAAHQAVLDIMKVNADLLVQTPWPLGKHTGDGACGRVN